MIDLHSHVLPGIDDGPDSIEGSLALARAAAAAGTRTLLATPHVSWRYPNDASTIARLVDELNERLRTERIELEVRPGAEIAMTRLADVEPEELSRLELGGSRWLLVEPPSHRCSPALTRSCRTSSTAGIASCSPIRSAVTPSTATRRCSNRSCAPGCLHR